MYATTHSTLVFFSEFLLIVLLAGCDEPVAPTRAPEPGGGGPVAQAVTDTALPPPPEEPPADTPAPDLPPALATDTPEHFAPAGSPVAFDEVATEMAVPVPGTATLPPRPSATSQPRIALTGNVPAEDVAHEMFLGVGGGGGYEPCLYYGSYDPSGQIVDQMILTACELMQPVTLHITGWPDDQPVRLSILDAGGRSMGRDVQRDAYGNLRVQYQPWLSDPTGAWVFELAFGSRPIRWEVNIQPPQQRYLYLLSDDPFQPVGDTRRPPYRLLLIGFQPAEAVRLLAYDIQSGDTGMQMRLSGSQDLTVGPDGALVLVGDRPDVYYLAYGEQTGEAHMLYGYPFYGDPFAGNDLVCPGAPVSRLRLRAQAVVLADLLPVAQSPGYYAPLSISEAGGAILQVLGRQRCFSGAFWFEITLPDGSTGWVPETRDGVYVLEPGE